MIAIPPTAEERYWKLRRAAVRVRIGQFHRGEYPAEELIRLTNEVKAEADREIKRARDRLRELGRGEGERS